MMTAQTNTKKLGTFVIKFHLLLSFPCVCVCVCWGTRQVHLSAKTKAFLWLFCFTQEGECCRWEEQFHGWNPITKIKVAKQTWIFFYIFLWFVWRFSSRLHAQGWPIQAVVNQKVVKIWRELQEHKRLSSRAFPVI